MNRERLTYDFLANSDLSGGSANLWPLRRRTILNSYALFLSKQVIKTVVTALTA